MIWRVAVLAAAVSLVLGRGSAIATAAPDIGPIRCNYTLSAPRVVTVSGTPMVTATLQPADCTGTANPKSSQVCIDTGASVGRCVLVTGYTTAQVYFSPYVPGVDYVAKGVGCAGLSTPPTVICSSLGPSAVVL